MNTTSLIYQYVLNVIAKNNVAAQDASFLHTPLVIVKPKSNTTIEPDEDSDNIQDDQESESEPEISEITKGQVNQYTDNSNVTELFNAGLTKILILPVENIADAQDIINANLQRFFTILISNEFSNNDIATLDTELFKGVTAITSTDQSFAQTQANLPRYNVYFSSPKNFFFLWGKFLSSPLFSNLQYTELVADDGINDLATADILFNSGVSFSLKDSQNISRLSFFAAGKDAIISPYILKEIELKLQDATINWIQLNYPQYNVSACSLLAQYLQGKVINDYINWGQIKSGSIEITAQNQYGYIDNFVANGKIVIPKPSALWRINASLYNE
jgi:hypothetical protein